MNVLCFAIRMQRANLSQVSCCHHPHAQAECPAAAWLSLEALQILLAPHLLYCPHACVTVLVIRAPLLDIV